LAISFDGELMPKNDFILDVISPTKPLILPTIQSFTDLIPSHKPLTISAPMPTNSLIKLLNA